MKQITIKMLREMNELAIKETEQYADSLAALIKPEPRGLVHSSIINGGYHAINFILEYLIKQLEEERQ